METNIVIGANFGDEGKGLITDFYAARSKENCLVIRHNSSAQAGHSVTMKDGRRHVFGHIGAGSFSGAATYLSRFFVCNPLLFFKEYMALQELCIVPDIYVDQHCLVTTPYDIIINQLIEEKRGAKRHGSCGVGFGETIERSTHPQFKITVKDLDNLEGFLKKLLAIRNEWLPKRLTALGAYKIPLEWTDRIQSKKLLEDFIDQTGFLLRTVKKVDGLPQQGFDQLVFEGAQGLLLDQDHTYFPHVTRSSTGLKNALTVLQEAKINQARVTYVTRSYLTRHGAGPMPYELRDKPYENIIDPTNITNEYQGHLRFAWLDIDALAQAIHKDFSLVPAHMQIDMGLAVTCVDQIDDLAGFIHNGVFQKKAVNEFLQTLHERIEAPFNLASFGPTREDIRLL